MYMHAYNCMYTHCMIIVCMYAHNACLSHASRDNRSLWGMRNFIHVNLCGCLFIAQLLFVTTVDKTDNVVSLL